MEKYCLDKYLGITSHKIVVDQFRIGVYENDGTNLALTCFTGDDEHLLTVNLGPCIGNGSVMRKNCAFLDMNDLPWTAAFLMDIDAGEVYTRFGEPVVKQSGFVEYPLFRFDESWLKEQDPDGYEKYVASYNESFEGQLQKILNGLDDEYDL